MLLKDRTAIILADKNVPSVSWDAIAEIAGNTRSVLVPVIPDSTALQTTTVTGARGPDGTIVQNGETRIYPFSLLFLSVCMARVLDRTPNTHEGKLDSGVSNACLVVVKFYAFYQGISAQSFVGSLQRKMSLRGAFCTLSPIRVPFFERDLCGDFPEELSEVLIEALQANVRQFLSNIMYDHGY
jgi:hypothetical protein